jgi:hypothetical protein
MNTTKGQRYRGFDTDTYALDPGLAMANKSPIPRSTTIVGFAPAKGVCVSRAGRRREVHAWDKDGRCVYCPVWRMES